MRAKHQDKGWAFHPEKRIPSSLELSTGVLLKAAGMHVMIHFALFDNVWNSLSARERFELAEPTIFPPGIFVASHGFGDRKDGR